MSWKKRGSETTIKEVVLRNTGLSEIDFLFPNRDPVIENLEQAVKFITEAVRNKEHITVMGDYDADGITASAILYRLLVEGFGYKDITMRFPKRFSEGYGLKMTVIDEISSGLLITVDNGIAAVDEIAAAKEKGISVVVIDHHLPNPDKGLPNADVVVDPNALPNSEFSGYCGAGLAYKTALKSGVCSPKLLSSLLSLAAIGTVADVMELVGDNRNIVISGLQAINDGTIPIGLADLLEKLDLYEINETDIGFKIGPIINACGRLYDDGAKFPFYLLALDNYNPKLPERLIEINEQRKTIVKNGLNSAEMIIAQTCLYGDSPMIVYAEKTFHEGVVGIIAGKLAEKFKVPVFVLTEADEPDVLKGSGRSYGDFNLKELLDKVSDLMIGYGGHAGAAGLSLKKENLELLRETMKSEVEKSGYSEADEQLYYDLEIKPNEIEDSIKELNTYAPFGQGNPKVLFKVRGYKLMPRNGKFFQIMGDGSIIKLFGDNSLAIGFGLTQKFDDEGQPMSVDLYGNLGINKFNHKDEIQVELNDFERTASQNQGSSLANLLSQRMKMF